MVEKKEKTPSPNGTADPSTICGTLQFDIDDVDTNNVATSSTTL
jgi:hypothetical protein